MSDEYAEQEELPLAVPPLVIHQPIEDPTTETASSQLPATTKQTALEKKYTATILRSEPGLGQQAELIASSLIDSGLPGAAVMMIINAVYAPNDPQGRGQSTRLHWFMEALRSRYQHRLDKIRKNYQAFRVFASEMEDLNEMRDMINGNGYGLSFHDVFNLWELGEDADSVMCLLDSLDSGMPAYVRVSKLKTAITYVQAGQFIELATALKFLNPNDEVDL